MEFRKASQELPARDKEAICPRTPQDLGDLDFAQQGMVSWFSPAELVKSGIKSLVSGLFGAYADRRELESVLAPAEWYDYSTEHLDEDGFWIDYVADLGDGFNPTYTVARLLAEERLDIKVMPDQAGSEKEMVSTRRGRILIMGGDQVYPTASREEYHNRLVGPYRAALPFVAFDDRPPHLFAIPGNHDWYDGLTSFFKQFCQQRWIGGWRTWQNRSYFAIKVTSDCWIWAIDIQLDADIDKPQIDYFRRVSSDLMEPNSRVILCVAEPSWLYAKPHDDPANWNQLNEHERKRHRLKKAKRYANVDFIHQRVMVPNGHKFAIGIAGDLHNYMRYESEDGFQRFVSGGGGAYLAPTHNEPESLTIFEPGGTAVFERKSAFPSKDDSARLARRSLFFALYPQNWAFALFLGSFYLLIAWVLQSVSKISAKGSDTLLEKMQDVWYLKLTDVQSFIEVIAHSPGSVVLLLILLAGMVAYAENENPRRRFVLGIGHGLAHLALLLYSISLFAWINLTVLGLHMDHPPQVVLFGFEMLLIGGTLGGVIMGLYLWIANTSWKVHNNEVLMCQSNPDYKSFLRLHIDKEGRITIYPIGLTSVCDDWDLRKDASNGEAWFEPSDGNISDLAHLIEPPVQCNS